jgi:hypothetical protein
MISLWVKLHPQGRSTEILSVNQVKEKMVAFGISYLGGPPQKTDSVENSNIRLKTEKWARQSPCSQKTHDLVGGPRQ